MIEIPVATAVTAALPIAKSLVEKVFKPIATKLFTGAGDKFIDIFGDRFSDYLSRQLSKHSYLPTIVFQVRCPLEDLYIPLTVHEMETIESGIESHKKFKFDRYHNSFLPEIGRVLVIDDAGMGKTTASRFLFVQLAKNYTSIPIFIELRHLSSTRSIIDHILSELNPVGGDPNDPKINKRELVRLLEKGVFTFFLDGYDEILTSHREAVTQDIKRMTEAFPENKFMVTSRPEQALSSFPSFKAFRIAPLKKDEAYSLIRKYDKDGEKSKKLIERLGDKSLEGIQGFLRNPLLTTLLYRAYDYKNYIPLKKHLFYRQVFDALFEWHDLSKDGYSTREKASKLDIDGFHKVLRGLGFISVLKGEIEVDTDTFLHWIRQVKKNSPELKFSESDFLEDSVKAVPIFRREGTAILWAHKSLAEYFAAQFVVSDSQESQDEICNAIASKRNLFEYANFLDLLYDTDYTTFGHYFIKPMLALYESELQILKTRHSKIDAALIERRAAVSFGKRSFIHPVLMRTNKFSNATTAFVQDSISKCRQDWYGSLDGTIEDKFEFPFGLEFPEFGQSDPPWGLEKKRRMVSVLHPLRIVFEILVEKKNPLVTTRAYYFDEVKNATIVGLGNSLKCYLDDNNSEGWNSPANFNKTTSSLMRITKGVLNRSRISQSLRDIETSRKPTSMMSLLNESK